jgi:hypothetical protein
MPIGEHLARCFECGRSFLCGDCIETICRDCECKRIGIHLAFGNICGRCGKILTKEDKDVIKNKR